MDLVQKMYNNQGTTSSIFLGRVSLSTALTILNRNGSGVDSSQAIVGFPRIVLVVGQSIIIIVHHEALALLVNIGIGLVAVNFLVALAALVVLDEAVDDVVLQDVHQQREDEHDKGDLERLAAFGPAQGPVADPWEPRKQSEEEPDEELHAHQADGVYEQLLEEPGPAGRAAVVAGGDGLGRSCKTGAKEDLVEDFEEDDQHGDTNGGLRVVLALCSA
jgi:hypothetical protein